MRCKMIREHRRRKRGSYRSKHRNNVSRWHENIVEQLERNRRVVARRKMYETVDALMSCET